MPHTLKSWVNGKENPFINRFPKEVLGTTVFYHEVTNWSTLSNKIILLKINRRINGGYESNASKKSW